MINELYLRKFLKDGVFNLFSDANYSPFGHGDTCEAHIVLFHGEDPTKSYSFVFNKDGDVRTYIDNNSHDVAHWLEDAADSMSAAHDAPVIYKNVQVGFYHNNKCYHSDMLDKFMESENPLLSAAKIGS